MATERAESPRNSSAHGTAALLPALLALIAACGAGDRGGHAPVVVRDSAGIVIVENAVIPGPDALGWRIADSPAVVIGSAEGEADDVLHNVSGALRLPDGRIVIADTEHPEYRVYGADGALERIVRWTPAAALPVSDEETARIKAEAVDRAPPAFRPRIQRVYEAMPFPRTKTPFIGIHIDAEGCVWATTWPDPESGRHTAAVFAADGRVLGSVELPPALAPGLPHDIHDIGADYLLARVTDELGVESVRLYRLERTRGCQPS